MNADVNTHEPLQDLDIITRLHQLSTRLVQSSDFSSLLYELLDAGIEMTGADMGSIQLLEKDGLRIVAHRGLDDAFLQFFGIVKDAVGAGGAALQRRERIMVENVASSDLFADPVVRDVMLEANINAVQSTPLVSRDGRVLGVLSTHYHVPGPRDERELRVLDLLGRQAADWIERAESERALRDSEAALREADARKDRFLATLAHEMRNPLAPVMNALEIMRRAGGEPAIIRDALATMHRQMTQMVRMIDDLLDITRITRDALDLRKERVTLASVISGALEACLPIAHAHGHEVRTDLPQETIDLDADPARLTQVFSNLLSNACKFTGRGGVIEVNAKRLGPEVVVRVIDNGVGIPPEQLQDVFEMFTQVGPASGRPAGGLGIGLHLVKRLVAMHGGTVIARSEGLGHGSEFVVCLPVMMESADPSRRSGSTRVTSPATPRRRILVVDDNEDAAMSLSVLLKLTGHDSQIATDGTQALQKAVTYQPDVILLDIDLPKMNGYDVCRAIRDHAWGRNMVMIALTGWGQEQDRQKSKSVGFNGHLVKPVDHAALMKLLSEAGVMSTRRAMGQ